jgi:ABC-2 type transport system permease protein
MNSMKKTCNIFLLFTKYSIKTTFQSPLGVFLFMLGKMIRFGMFFAFIYYLLINTKLLAGYTLEQTLIFYLTFNIIDSTAQLLYREVYRFRPLIVNAEFDTILTKPYHPFLRVLLGGIDPMDAVITLIYIAVMIFFIITAGPFSPINILGYMYLVINGLVIATSFHITVLALGILTTEVDHTIMIYRDITKMGSFPVDIYKQPLQFFFTFVLPIGIMMTFPVKSLFGQLNIQGYVISFLLSFSALIGSLILWDKALKKYQSWGG